MACLGRQWLDTIALRLEPLGGGRQYLPINKLTIDGLMSAQGHSVAGWLCAQHLKDCLHSEAVGAVTGDGHGNKPIMRN